MLIWMRNSAFAGALKFILMGLLLMAVVGLILMDRNGTFQSNLGNHDLVKGAGVSISPFEFDRTARRVLSSQGIGAAEARQLGLIDNILNSEIQTRLFARASRNLGLEVGDEAVKKQIAKLAEPLASNGRSKREALQQILRTQNISESEFISSIRQEMGNGLLRAALNAPAALASPALAQNLYRYDDEKRGADVLILDNASVSDVTKPTAEQMEKYYDANKIEFLIPETRTVTVATLTPDMVKKNIKITDEDLKAEYEKNTATFTKPPRRLVEQVVLQSEDDAKKALADMNEGKTVKDSNTLEFERAGLLPEIAGPVFEAKEGATVGPIQTALGWHVLKIKKLLPEQVTPFEDVKDKLKSELEGMHSSDEMYQTGNAIEDRVAGGAGLDEIVGEYGLTTEIIGPFRQNGNYADGKDLFKSYGTDRDKMVQAAFDYTQGEISTIVETADGQFHILRIDQVVPDKYKPLETVKATLEKRWMDEQRRLFNSERAKLILESLNTGKTLDAAAQENKLPVRTFKNIGRTATPPAPLTAVVAAQIFAAEKGKAFSSEIADGYVVGTITDISIPQSKPQAGDKDYADLLDLSGRTLSNDILSEYMNGLTNGKAVKINTQMLDQMYPATPTANGQ